MMSHEEMESILLKTMYGEKSRPTLIQRLFIKILPGANRMVEMMCGGFFMSPSINTAINAKKIEDEIDKKMPAPSSPRYNKFLAMKSFTYFARGSAEEQNGYDPEFLKKTVDLLEPVKLEPEAIYLYIESLNLLGYEYVRHKQVFKAFEYLNKAEKAYEEFIAKSQNADKKVMFPTELFGVVADLDDNVSFLTKHYCTSIHLYNGYKMLEDEEMKRKYAMSSIKGIFMEAIDARNLFPIKYDVFAIRTNDQIQMLIKMHHFAQVDYLLSLLMSHLVKERRLMSADLDDIIYAQSLVSHLYAAASLEILTYSINSLKDPSYAENNPINHEVHSFEELEQDGVKIYQNQFPCKRITTHEGLVKTLKKGKSWCTRAIDISVEEFTQAQDTLKSLVDTEKEIKHFEHLK